MTEKYKYKIGQKVKYTVLDSKETKCECCGNVEEDYFDKKVSGKIIGRYYDILYSVPSYSTTNKVEVKNGKTFYTPCISDINIPKSEPCYEIKRDNGIEEDRKTEKSIKLN